MKLAIVIPGFQSGPDDWCIPAFTNLARELARSNEVHVFALRYPARRETYTIGAVTVHAVGGGAFGVRRVPGLSLVRLWADVLSVVRKEHRTTKFDAILGIWATESGWLATNIAGLFRLPSVVHLAGGELAWLPEIKYGNAGGGLARLLVGSCIRRATLLTVPSLPVLRLAERKGIPASRLRMWPLGLDTSMFSPAESSREQIQARPFVFATAGSLIPVKDHEWMINAFAMLRQKLPGTAVQLRIAGDGPLRSRLEGLVRELGLEGYVDLVDDLPHDQLPSFYRSADCFVLSSHYEAQCMAALEAMACGLPWAGPPVGALADLAFEGESGTSGLPVTQRTTEALAEAMKTVLEMPQDARAAMGEEAWRAVGERYNLDQQVSELGDILRRLTVQGAVATITRAYQ